MPIANTLFKFVAVRPVQKVSPDDLRRRFIRYAAGNGQPPIYEPLLERDTMPARKELASGYILSDDYIAGFDHDAPWVRSLQQLLVTLTRVVRRRNGVQAARQEAQQWVEQHGQQLNDIKDRLWSSLYAAVLSPRTLPHDRKELIDLIRVCHFVEHRDTVTEPQQVATLLQARPLAPEELFVVQTVPQEPDDGPLPANWQQQQRELFEQVRDRIYDLRDAVLEIQTVERRVLHQLESNGHRPTPIVRESHAGAEMERVPAENPARVSAGATNSPLPHTQDNDGPRVKDSPDVNRWRLPSDAVEALSDSTRQVVSDHGLSLQEDSTVDILNGLENAQRQHFETAYKTGGLQAVKTAGLSRAYNQGQLPDELLQNVTRDYDVPWLFQQNESSFDETIEGAVGSVKPIGIGDLLVVKDTIWKYEPGEVAHIENILQSESKERVHRRLDRTEQTIFTETETTSQSERDLQTTERFELQTEVQRTLQQESELGLGVGVSGGYGPVKVSTSAEFATSNSQSQSASTASSFAQEITDRSVESLTERVKESLLSTVINEIEETNTHGFDNTDGNGHVSGVYRWVDKYYLSQIYNYGKRLMFEFIVPEPAAFYLHARQAAEAAAAGSLTPPEPLGDDFSFTDIDPGTYQTWVDAYQVANASPPPPLYKLVAKSYEQSSANPGTRADTMTVPEGYVAKEAHLDWSYTYTGLDRFTVIVGQQKFSLHSDETFHTLDDEDSVVPISLNANNILAYALNVEVKCQRSDETLQAWQLTTYNAIVEAYNQQKAAYEAQLAAHEISQGVLISGNNPDENRRIEREELKRGALTLFTNQHFADFDATRSNVPTHGYPEFDVAEAMEEAGYVQFFEQAFEWDKVSYLFYPYFWGNKAAWATNSQHSDTDPVFGEFLRAGSARVLVPVRRNYEESIIYYLRTGEIWNGGEMPTINNNLYVSIVDELLAAADATLANAEPVGDPWELKLPTELVQLQEDAVLPDWTDELFQEQPEPESEPELALQ